MLFFTVISSNAQFQTCNSNTTKHLNDVYFIDSQTGIAVGDSGTILRSTDGGLNWTTVLSVDTIRLTKVKFFDNNTGIAMGTQLYKTTDGGQNWGHLPHANTFFFDIEIVNDSTCFISGTPTPLIKSTNAGLTFVDLITTPTPQIGLLSFVNDTLGYACMYTGGFFTKTLKTINGGVSWNLIEDTISTIYPTVMEAMSFVSENKGFKAGWYAGLLMNTKNGSNKWDAVVQDTINQGQILDLHIESNMPNAYYASGWYGEIYKSTDGGNNWFSLVSGVNNITNLTGIFFINNLTGWVVGYNGTIIKTTSGGIGIDENTNEIQLKIYPNPAQDRIYIATTEGLDLQQVDFFDLQGKQILSTKVLENGIDISGLANGVYVLNIKTEKGVLQRKVVKE